MKNIAFLAWIVSFVLLTSVGVYADGTLHLREAENPATILPLSSIQPVQHLENGEHLAPIQDASPRGVGLSKFMEHRAKRDSASLARKVVIHHDPQSYIHAVDGLAQKLRPDAIPRVARPTMHQVAATSAAVNGSTVNRIVRRAPVKIAANLFRDASDDAAGSSNRSSKSAGGNDFADDSIDTVDSVMQANEGEPTVFEGDIIYQDSIHDFYPQPEILADGQDGSCLTTGCSCGNCATCCGDSVAINPLVSRFGCGLRDRIFGGCCKAPYSEAGIGHEWLPYAPFTIQRAAPLNHIGFRVAAAYDHSYPDRSEYLWAKSPGGGPNAGVGERSVDYQDFRFRFEAGGKRFSAATEIPIRVLDPVLNENTAGLGDMTLTTRAVLFDGQTWQITQVMNSYFNTGSATHGTGNGHISLEPGILARWEYSDFTHIHGELKYWFPLGADADHAGEVLRYGIGCSHLTYDCDSFGLITTLEFVGGTFLDGQQTPSGAVVAEDIDGIGFLNIHPGARFIFDSPGDWGTWDFGVGGGFAVTGSRMYDAILTMDLRWAF